MVAWLLNKHVVPGNSVPWIAPGTAWSEWADDVLFDVEP